MHIDDILRRGEPDLWLKVRRYSDKRFRKLAVEKQSFAHVGIEVAEEDAFFVTLIREDFSKNLKFPPTPSKLWAVREEPPSMDESKARQCKLGDLSGSPRRPEATLFAGVM